MEWVILGIIPRVPDGDDELGETTTGDIALTSTVAPPRVSVLTVARRISPNPITRNNFPNVLAADPGSGLLLLFATHGRRTGPVAVNKPGRERYSWRTFVEAYYVCDAASSTAMRLPDPDVGIIDAGNVGLVTTGCGSYMVVELQPVIGTDLAILLCFSSPSETTAARSASSTSTGCGWTEKTVKYPLPPRPWGGSGVLSHQGRLWWIDLSWGLLTCDPFDETPKLRFVPLPDGKVLPFTFDATQLDKSRCVKLSGGRLRFVEISESCTVHRPRPMVIVRKLKQMYSRVHTTPPQVRMWTLTDAEEWALEYQVSLEEVWDDETYSTTGLPKMVPVLALVHPSNPQVLFFFLEDHLFSVDMINKKVLKCIVHELAYPPRQFLSSRFVMAWELPPSMHMG